MKKLLSLALALAIALTSAILPAQADASAHSATQAVPVTCTAARPATRTAAPVAAYVSRDEIPDRYKWDLSEIYPGVSDWGRDVDLLESEIIPLIAIYEGGLNDRDNVISCFNALGRGNDAFTNVYLYAALNMDMDLSDPAAQEMYGKAIWLNQSLDEAASYIYPELAQLGEAVLSEYIADPDFAAAKKILGGILADRPRILSQRESELLAMSVTFGNSPAEIHTMLNDVDMRFGSVTDGEGRDIEVTASNISELMKNPDRDFRRSASDAYSAAYMSLNNTFAAILSAEVNYNIFLARANKYDSALEASLSADSVPVSVYDNLVDSVGAGLDAYQRFYDLRRGVLKLDKVRGYDMSVPLVPQARSAISYGEARRIIMEALRPLGAEYGETLESAFEGNWIDVYHTPNKRSGAYSYGVRSPHPFIMMNYTGDYSDLTILAHELGHAIHQYYSYQAQSPSDGAVANFTSEVAAILNEVLLHKYMIEKSETDAERLIRVNDLLNTYVGSFFDQARNAEFEKLIYERAESGKALNADSLNGIWLSLARKYSGGNYEANEAMPVGWSAIPHFYYNFYVYKYATSVAAASQIATGILGGKPRELRRYLGFLRSGSRQDPIATLLRIGVDMNSPRVIDGFIDEFESLVDEMERLLIAEGLIE
jgi:oligoendopeptidase F